MYFEKLKNQNILITRMKIKNIYNFSNNNNNNNINNNNNNNNNKPMNWTCLYAARFFKNSIRECLAVW
jgi:hypothetical protein